MPSLPFLFIAAFFTLTPVTLSIYPPVSMAPATFRIRTIIDRHEANRTLCVAYEGPEYKRSCFPIDGAQSARVFQSYWNLRVSGEYEAVADLTRMEAGTERHYVERHAFRVLGF